MYLSHVTASKVLPTEMLRNRAFHELNAKETAHKKLSLKYGHDGSKLKIFGKIRSPSPSWHNISYQLVITVVIKLQPTLIHGYSHVHFVFVITDCSWSGWDNGAIFNIQSHGDRVGCSLLKTPRVQECRWITNIYRNESF